jgi:hypothetical protein
MIWKMPPRQVPRQAETAKSLQAQPRRAGCRADQQVIDLLGAERQKFTASFSWL